MKDITALMESARFVPGRLRVFAYGEHVVGSYQHNEYHLPDARLATTTKKSYPVDEAPPRMICHLVFFLGCLSLGIYLKVHIV